MTQARPLVVAQQSPALAQPDPVEALLLALLLEVRGLRNDLTCQRPASTLSRDDRARLARLLPAIGGVFGSELFLTKELFTSDAAALRVVTHGLNPRHVGRLFRRAEGQTVDGYLVQREGLELNATLWRVLHQVPEFLTPAILAVPPTSRDGLA